MSSNQGVKFLNPNASAVCGCGESFTVNDLNEEILEDAKKKDKSTAS